MMMILWNKIIVNLLLKLVKPPSASRLFKNRLIIGPMFKVKATKSTLRTVHCEVLHSD